MKRPACFRRSHWSAVGWLLCLWILSVGPAVAERISFERVFEEHDVVMLLIEPESGRIVDANPAAAKFYGHARDALQSMTIQQINTFTPEQVAAERRLAETEGRNYFIFRHRLADGEVRTVEVHSRLYPVDGRGLLLSVIKDITPGRHAASDLWHYQQRLEEMVDAQVREIEQSRRSQARIMIGAMIAQAIVIGLLVVTIQRRRRLEREREELLDTLRARNQELQRLGEVMAHHFQEPVRRLVSYAQRLQRHADLAANDDARQSLGFIDEQARRLSALTGDVQRYLALDHGILRSGGASGVPAAPSPGSGSQEPESGTIDVARCLRKVIDGRRNDLAEVQVSIVEPLPAIGLPEKSLRQLFAIVVDNALRYRHDERPLSIRVTGELVAGRVRLRFVDNGRGIEPEYRDKVFGLFTRLVGNDVPGTGVGLALVRKMVALVQGRVWIEDGIDGGTAVVFDLPKHSVTDVAKRG